VIFTSPLVALPTSSAKYVRALWTGWDSGRTEASFQLYLAVAANPVAEKVMNKPIMNRQPIINVRFFILLSFPVMDVL